MNAKELREMTVEELTKKLGELKEELFNLRFQLAVNQLDKPHKITEVKHDIARVMTVLREKNA
ncbi:MAG: 50S ribosomal protein L29 [Clostridia bacterium]|nr:50S ribosomal protein L29 [Clostridia bacterium]